MLRLAIAMAVLLTSPVGAYAESPHIDAATVREIERQVVMPDGSRPLSEYDRYYATTELSGLGVITGVFLYRSTHDYRGRGSRAVAGVPHAFTTHSLPVLADGGCSVVTIIFNLRTRKLTPIAYDGERVTLAVCNGRA